VQLVQISRLLRQALRLKKRKLERNLFALEAVVGRAKEVKLLEEGGSAK